MDDIPQELLNCQPSDFFERFLLVDHPEVQIIPKFHPPRPITSVDGGESVVAEDHDEVIFCSWSRWAFSMSRRFKEF